MAREVAACDGLHGLGERSERLGKELRLRHGDRYGDEERHQERKAQSEDIDAFQAVARQGKLAVIAVGRFDRLGITRERRRHRRSQLHEPRFGRDGERLHWHDRAQAERPARNGVDTGLASLQTRLTQ